MDWMEKLLWGLLCGGDVLAGEAGGDVVVVVVGARCECVCGSLAEVMASVEVGWGLDLNYTTVTTL
eukprot:m.165940 g.165940  ORF g.165940 m.165940 type:complete len:66 (-) comp24024_c1_seq1:5473-5670(-)